MIAGGCDWGGAGGATEVSVTLLPASPGAAAVTVAASGGYGPNCIALDEANVYWTYLGFPGGKEIDAGSMEGSVRSAPTARVASKTCSHVHLPV